MLDSLKGHPSDIAESAIGYLQSLKVAEKTKRTHADILNLFISSLLEHPDAVVDGNSDEPLLEIDWLDLHPDVIEDFIDWWIPRRVLGPDYLHQKAPGIMRKWLLWCKENGYISEGFFQESKPYLGPGKKKEIERLQKATHLLYRIHTPDPGSWKNGKNNNVVPIHQKEMPIEVADGYLRVSSVGPQSVELRDGNGNRFQQVFVGTELTKVLRVGDVVNVCIGRYSDTWKVLESGNVYAGESWT